MSRVSNIKETTPFKIYDLLGLEDLQEPEPLIQDVLTRGCIAMLFGEYGTGKSFLALDWAAHLATGQSWHGHEIKQEYHVLYVAAEGAGGLKRRLKAWQMEYGDIPADNFHLTRVAVRFANDEDHYDYLEQLIKENAYDFIVIDTLSRNTPGMDENGPDMTVFIESCFALRDAHSDEKTAFLIVHHAGKDRSKGPRGWSGLPAATDFSYRMSKGELVYTLSTDRTKDAESLTEMSFKLKVHLVDPEWNRTSCTLELDDQTSNYMASEQERDTTRAAARESSEDMAQPMTGGNRRRSRRANRNWNGGL